MSQNFSMVDLINFWFKSEFCAAYGTMLERLNHILILTQKKSFLKLRKKPVTPVGCLWSFIAQKDGEFQYDGLNFCFKLKLYIMFRTMLVLFIWWVGLVLLE